MDWTKCIVCQEVTEQPLKCPMNSASGTYEEKKETYKTFLENVEEFCTIDALPVKLLFGNDTSPDTLAENLASWHKGCHLKFNNTKLSKAKKRKGVASVEVTQRSGKRACLDKQVCILCTEGDEIEQLHNFSTFDADAGVRAMVTDLQDSELLSRMATGDLIAIEAKYHRKCFVSLRNRHRAHIRKRNAKEENFNEKMDESVAFIELTNYIERCVESGTLLFKLTELHAMYVNHLQSKDIHKVINKTRLKEQLLKRLPEAQEQFDGRNTIIIFESGMITMIREAIKKRDYTEDAYALSKVANIIRRDMLQHDTYTFTGSFTSRCQEASVPASLKALVSMILHGTKLDDQQGKEPQACMTIAQVITFNAKNTIKHTHKNEHSRHSLQREPPLPLYVGLTIHNTIRSKKK